MVFVSSSSDRSETATFLATQSWKMAFHIRLGPNTPRGKAMSKKAPLLKDVHVGGELGMNK